MIYFPAHAQIHALICPGRTYLFKAEEHFGDKKHYQVVLNMRPQNDAIIVMVTATTITLKHLSNDWERLAQDGIAIQAVKGDAPFISVPTVFRCDSPVIKPKELIISKLDDKSLIQSDVVGEPLLEKLRQAVLLSKTVSEDTKVLIRGY